MSVGLDGCGDGWQHDTGRAPSRPLGITASEVTGHSAVITWHPSVGPNGDPVTYKVRHRMSGTSMWSKSVETLETTLALTELEPYKPLRRENHRDRRHALACKEHADTVLDHHGPGVRPSRQHTGKSYRADDWNAASPTGDLRAGTDELNPSPTSLRHM